jgi:hypothetical protein
MNEKEVFWRIVPERQKPTERSTNSFSASTAISHKNITVLENPDFNKKKDTHVMGQWYSLCAWGGCVEEECGACGQGGVDPPPLYLI